MKSMLYCFSGVILGIMILCVGMVVFVMWAIWDYQRPPDGAVMYKPNGNGNYSGVIWVPDSDQLLYTYRGVNSGDDLYIYDVSEDSFEQNLIPQGLSFVEFRGAYSWKNDNIIVSDVDFAPATNRLGSG